MSPYEETESRPWRFMLMGEHIWYKRPAPKSQQDASAEIPDVHTILDFAITQLLRWMRQSDDVILRHAALPIADWFGGHILQKIMHYRAFERTAEQVIPNIKTLLTLPGRSTEGWILTEIAKRERVPTFEIQSGPISATPRFPTPIAGRVLCMDEASRRIYVDYQKRPEHSVRIVGAPKLDYDLLPYKKYPKTRARYWLRRVGMPQAPDARVVMLAGQPIGADMMAVLARMVVEAIEPLEDTWLFIKKHPSEGEPYSAFYRELFKRFPRGVLPAAAPLHPSIVACDVVCTYFSTVGIEAYCLNRPVISINPFGTPPPYDLVEVGAANTATTVEALRDMILNPRMGPGGNGIDMLRDGRSADRIASLARRAAEKYIERRTA